MHITDRYQGNPLSLAISEEKRKPQTQYFTSTVDFHASTGVKLTQQEKISGPIPPLDSALA